MHNFQLHTVFSPSSPPTQLPNFLTEAQRSLITMPTMTKKQEQQLLDKAFPNGWHFCDARTMSADNKDMN